jgi:DNA topoisomerase-1
MEESLDRIEEGKEDWVELLKQFYVHFHEDVQKALKEMKNVRDLAEATDELCDLCKKPMVIKWGRNGRFLACSGYPKCRNTKEIGDDATAAADLPPVDIKCEECGSPLVRKTGRYGGFLACTGYPECKVTRSLPTGIDCPQPKCKGELVERRTRRGRVFFGCSEYKATSCNFVVWGTPAKEACPNCEASFLVVTNRRKGGRELKCVTEGCGYKRSES